MKKLRGFMTPWREVFGLLHFSALLSGLIFSGCYQSAPARDASGIEPAVDAFPDPGMEDLGPVPDIPVEPSIDPVPEPGDPPVDPVREDPVADPEPPEDALPDLYPDPDLPAVLLWGEPFDEPPVRWERQNGDWEWMDGIYCQNNFNSFAESWVPAETWEDLAVEVSFRLHDADVSAVKNVMGAMYRVQQISRNKYYLCGLDFISRTLSIVKYDQDVLPGYATLCELPLDRSPPR